MPELSGTAAAFLAAAGCDPRSAAAIAGDLSARSYFRVAHGPGTAILMDASGEPASVPRFLHVTDWLLANDFSAPRVLAQDTSAGLLLLDDFGSRGATKLLARDPAFRTRFYDDCIDLLLALRAAPAPDLPCPSAAELARWTALADEFYPGADTATLSAFRAALETVLAEVAAPPTVSLRDFHADNIMWLPDRSGLARFGLLDYQDAFLVHPVYDLVSLLTDARTEVSREQRAQGIATYAARSGDEPQALATAFAAYSAQRNLRILGIFTRAARQGKPHHLPKLARVHGYLAEALEHPAFAAVRYPTLAALPDPAAAARALAS